MLVFSLVFSLTACDAHRTTEVALHVRRSAMTDSTAVVRGARVRLTASTAPAACTVDPGFFDVSGWLAGSYPTSRRGDGSVCATTVMSFPDTPYPLLQSAFWDREQKANLDITFSRGVGDLHLSGMGAIKCSGATYGTAIAYSADSGELGRADFSLIDPSDCSPPSNPDDVTFGAEATLSVPAGVRRIVILPPQPWSFDVLGNEGFVTAFYTISFVEADAQTPTVEVVSANGPNSDGSFTVLPAESRVSLSAVVVPSSLASRVRWLVSDDSLDLLEAVGPLSVPDGAASVFVVPSAQKRERYSRYAHPGVLAQKSLALRVRAQVTDDNGRTVSSENDRVVRQDEIDTMREEYIELRVPQGVPARGEFVVPDAAHPNQSDYSRVLRNAAFDNRLSQLVSAWTERPLLGTITGGYRNPVHNWRHITVRSGSGPVGASWHMYGCALDFQTYPALRTTSSTGDTLAARAYWDRLSAKAIALGLRVEPRDRDPNQPRRPYSGVGHVHVEMRCR